MLNLSETGSNAILNRLFRRVDGVVWDLMSGKVGIRNSEGVVTFSLDQSTVESPAVGSVSINPFESFSVPIPAFASRVASNEVNPGDLVHGARGPLGWVVDRKEVAFTIMKPDGSSTIWSPPKVEMMGEGQGAMVVRSLLQIGGGKEGLGNFQSALLPMVMMGGLEGGDGAGMLDKMMPMMMMMQAGGAGGGMNQMMSTMMMMSMMKGKDGFF
jgi:hypothetical protein